MIFWPIKFMSHVWAKLSPKNQDQGEDIQNRYLVQSRKIVASDVSIDRDLGEVGLHD